MASGFNCGVGLAIAVDGGMVGAGVGGICVAVGARVGELLFGTITLRVG